MSETKVCNKCNVEKSIDEYTHESRSKDGRRNDCKECYNKRVRELRLINRDVINAKDKIRRNTPDKKLKKRKSDIIYRDKNKGKIAIGKKEWYLENRDELLLDKKLERRENPRKEMVKKAKQRAKEKSLSFDLCEDDIYIPDICPVLGIPLIVGDEKSTDNSPTLDRIDNTRGYTKDNVCVISWRANAIKRDSTRDELRKVLEYVERNNS